MIQELEPIRGCDMAGNIIYEGPPSEFSIMEKINEIIRYINSKERPEYDKLQTLLRKNGKRR